VLQYHPVLFLQKVQCLQSLQPDDSVVCCCICLCSCITWTHHASACASLAFVELVKVLVNGLTSVVSDTSGTKRTPYLRHLGNLLDGDFIKVESAFATDYYHLLESCCVSLHMPTCQQSHKLVTLHLFYWGKGVPISFPCICPANAYDGLSLAWTKHFVFSSVSQASAQIGKAGYACLLHLTF
jgi:hypothetical protein